MNDDHDLARRLASLRSSEGPAPWQIIEARLRREGLIADGYRPRNTRTRTALRHLVAAAIYASVGLGVGVALARDNVVVAPPRVAAAEAPLFDSASVMRLAVLETIVLTTAQALRETPGDSLIAHYHSAARTQRDAFLARTPPSSGLVSRWY